MKHALVISSFVAGSNVGGSLAMKALPQLGLEVSLLPTTLLGRHPGWGAPGGGAVSQEMFEGMAQGLVANDIPARADLAITGYFASADQVSLAADLISRHVSGRGLVVVDPIMGDDEKGLYISEAVADAIVRELLPLADIITPNTFEFFEIERRLGHKIQRSGSLPQRSEVRAQLSRQSEPYARYVTSVHDSGHIGIMAARNSELFYASAPFIKEGVPNGTGDLAALLIAHAELSGQMSAEGLDAILQRMQALIRPNPTGELRPIC
tara:strand:- start:23531 stop:24328 length:798 start_codon:yes stop_codon:yes gene_type:complete